METLFRFLTLPKYQLKELGTFSHRRYCLFRCNYGYRVAVCQLIKNKLVVFLNTIPKGMKLNFKFFTFMFCI